MIEQSEIERRVQGHGLVRGVDTLPKGHVRIETAFLYPDGSSVDVFLVEKSKKPNFRERFSICLRYLAGKFNKKYAQGCVIVSARVGRGVIDLRAPRFLAFVAGMAPTP